MEQQRRVLNHIMTSNARTEYGRQFGFADIATAEEFQSRVPTVNYDDIEPWIERIGCGDRSLLTADPVTRLIPSSGSTSAAKLIPFTRGLQEQFNRAIGPWVGQLFRAFPGLKQTTAYWSISPVTDTFGDHVTKIPVGFEDDSEYLGFWGRQLIQSLLTVPDSVRHLRDVGAFRRLTLYYLLRDEYLGLISVWHPTFLRLLLEELHDCWDALLETVSDGQIARLGVDPDFIRQQGLTTRGLPLRSKTLAAIRIHGSEDFAAVWPKLQVVSCWADGNAESEAHRLMQLLPKSVTLQPKGLVSTEAIISLPFNDTWPLAVTSHFIEFEDSDTGDIITVDQLQEGRCYEPIVTTGGGLYRYRMRDRIEVTGRIEQTPSIRFIGKSDRTSDRVGEKLSEGFVASVIGELLRSTRRDLRFALLAPDDSAGIIRYILYLQMDRPVPSDLAVRLEKRLQANPHYRYAVELGQLRPAGIQEVDGDPHAIYLQYQTELGQRLGDVKPALISNQTGWQKRFSGGPVEATQQSSVLPETSSKD